MTKPAVGVGAGQTAAVIAGATLGLSVGLFAESDGIDVGSPSRSRAS